MRTREALRGDKLERFLNEDVHVVPGSRSTSTDADPGAKAGARGQETEGVIWRALKMQKMCMNSFSLNVSGRHQFADHCISRHTRLLKRTPRGIAIDGRQFERGRQAACGLPRYRKAARMGKRMF